MITCDKCAYCSPTPGGSLYCALTDHFVPNLGCKDGEPINKPQTNADRIRSMTDEDLMRFLLRVGTLENRPWCDDEPCNNRYCSECITEWLKEEVSE